MYIKTKLNMILICIYIINIILSNTDIYIVYINIQYKPIHFTKII